MQIYVLLLPLHLLFLIMFSSPIVLGILFMGLYLLDMDRLYIPKDQVSQQKSSLVDSLFGLAGKDQFKIFISVSCCQPCLVSLGLTWDHLTTFLWQTWILCWLNSSLSSSVVQRILSSPQATSPPATPVCVDSQVLQNDLQDFELWNMQYFTGYHSIVQVIHWSQVALITKDKFSEHKTLHPDQMPLKYISWAPCCPLQTVVTSKWLQSLWNNLQLHLEEGLFSLQESCNSTRNCLPGQQPLPSFFPLPPILIWGRLIRSSGSKLCKSFHKNYHVHFVLQLIYYSSNFGRPTRYGNSGRPMWLATTPSS